MVKLALADFSQGIYPAQPGTGIVGGNNLHSHLLSEEIRAWDFAPKQGIKDNWFWGLNLAVPTPIQGSPYEAWRSGHIFLVKSTIWDSVFLLAKEKASPDNSMTHKGHCGNKQKPQTTIQHKAGWSLAAADCAQPNMSEGGAGGDSGMPRESLSCPPG